MMFLALVLVALAGHQAVGAQGSDDGRCQLPDTVTVSGNKRVAASTILTDAGLKAKTALNYPSLQRAIRGVFEGGQFDDVQLSCLLSPDGQVATLQINVKERPLLSDVDVVGADVVPLRTVRDRVDLLIGRPVDPAQVALAMSRIDSLYQANGFYLAQVRPETTSVGDRIKLLFRVDEGRRLAIAGVRVRGAQQVSERQVAKAMKIRPEGFFWWRKGAFDEDKYAGDLGERIPTLFAKQGFVDFQFLKDTLLIDRALGKGLIELTVQEGRRYNVGAFAVDGNKHFSTEDIQRAYPFTATAASLPQRVAALVRRKPAASNLFDRTQWDDATQKVRTMYSNEGYIYAQVRPVAEPAPMGPDSVPRVNLRWEITENQPAIINRVDILGNDYTNESCIREQLFVIPGDVFNQDRLIRSYQSLGNMGFFETPIPPPDTRPANEAGDVDVIFRVKEKRTGNINFGASMGQGTGVGGFIGLEQPNLWGNCKRGSVQWQYGRYINDFSLSYTDPAIRKSRISGTVTAYNSQARYQIADLGRSIRTGASLQVGFPMPNSRFTRLFITYGAEGVKFGSDGLLGTVANTTACTRCFRSNLGFNLQRDTRVDMPFATQGSMQSLRADFNGGPLGGTSNFQRYYGEMRAHALLTEIGGKKMGANPLKLTVGLSSKTGAVFGDPGAFFYSQSFSLGGVQFGEMLRGYPEFSVTPTGFSGSTGTYNAQRGSFGNAFFTATAEVGLRVSQQLYLNLFYDAGNIWAHPREIDPSRLYRGAGIGASVVTPLGPLGLDWAYGFDRTDVFGRPDPKFQLHFRLGQFF
ncbi:MAG: outer membrane protein assembly factor BamA [Gemmatimonadetes bacterium]|nr:outer membrane protein assembly factor BamA [Gemmatimonadota bacterium]